MKLVKSYNHVFASFIVLVVLAAGAIGQESVSAENGNSQKAVAAEAAKKEDEAKSVKADGTEDVKPSKNKEYSEAIADNSFYIEEAYNQEPGVMQTISTCAWFRRPSNDVGCTVTQEFPFKNQKHQLSYTIPVSFLDSNRVKGVGDISFNYRYQLTGENSWATVAPRVSLLVPSGSQSRGLGTGSGGLQLNLPVSKRLSESFAAHFNTGMTFLPKAKGRDSQGNSIKRALTAYNTGGSIVWLTHKRFNVLFEYVENFSSEIDDHGRVNRFNEHIFNPGIRFAVDIGSLQVVPGVALPTGVSRGEKRTGVFFYLSFEHPFSKNKP